MWQVEQLSHTTSDAIIHRFGRCVAFDNATGAYQDRCLYGLQRNIARIEEARALLGIFYASEAWTDTCEVFMR